MFLYQNILSREKSQREMETERQNKETSRETKDMEQGKEERRKLSVVTFTDCGDCVNIPDETGSKSSLSKKYISSTLLFHSFDLLFSLSVR